MIEESGQGPAVQTARDWRETEPADHVADLPMRDGGMRCDDVPNGWTLHGGRVRCTRPLMAAGSLSPPRVSLLFVLARTAAGRRRPPSRSPSKPTGTSLYLDSNPGSYCCVATAMRMPRTDILAGCLLALVLASALATCCVRFPLMASERADCRTYCATCLMASG